MAASLFVSCTTGQPYSDEFNFDEESDQEDTTSTNASEVAAESEGEEEEDDAITPLSLMANAMKALVMPSLWMIEPKPLPAKRQTVTFLDWDDTLLCTTFLSARQDVGLSAALEMQLSSIGATVAKVLEVAKRLGRVFIVTNAEDGWVQASAGLYLPRLLPALDGVAVRSARSKFEARHPNDMPKWKEKAFLEARRQMNPQIFTNVISIGDSPYEMTAARNLSFKFNEALLKTVKFKVHPSPIELQRQLDFVLRELAGIERAPSALDIEL